ncbi:MAG: hypothetical protein N3F64_00850 [Nitrososphaeria archaeon]|nr:hypothetical protein [Nitrososphaeria archaeon]
MRKNVRLSSLILTILIIFLAIQVIVDVKITSKNGSKVMSLNRAAEYIINRYDPRIGLVSESEDTGSNVPDSTPCYRTFWIYSDNLWAAKALEPYNYFIAKNISRTISPYIKNFGKPNLFEIVFGEKITRIRYDKENICVNYFLFDGINYTIWIDRHQKDDGGIFYDAIEYADLCLYLALNEYLYGNKENATRLLKIVDSMWNGYGFFDKAAKEKSLYQNYKLGLYLFTVKALEYNSTIYDQVERVAWSYQKENGGIATHSYLNGTICGTANVETTSIILLAYNDELISRFRKPNLDQIQSITALTILLVFLIAFSHYFKSILKYSVRK